MDFQAIAAPQRGIAGAENRHAIHIALVGIGCLEGSTHAGHAPQGAFGKVVHGILGRVVGQGVDIGGIRHLL